MLLMKMAMWLLWIIRLSFFPKHSVHHLREKETDNARVVCASIRYGADTSNPLTKALPGMVTLAFGEDVYVEATVQGAK